MLSIQRLSRAVRLSCIVFNYRFCTQLLGHASSERRHTNFLKDYSFHPIGKCEGGYAGWSFGSCSVSPEYPREFVYPFSFS